MNRRQPGRAAPVLGTAVAVLMGLGSWAIGPWLPADTGRGVCLPSPGDWEVLPFWSWAVNTVVLVAMAFAMALAGRRENFIKGNGHVLPVAFLVMTASDPVLTSALGTPSLLCAVALCALWLLSMCYKSPNATQSVFVAATLIALGSMLQYAFLMLVPVVLAVMAVMKVFRWRELVAFGMGLVAPYWTGIGLGLLPLSAFRLPVLALPQIDALDSAGPGMALAGFGLAAVLATVLGLNIMMRFYAGNSHTLSLNLAMAFTGLAAVVFMVLDSTSIASYMTVFYMCAAVQLANAFAMWPPRRPNWLLALFCTVYIALWAITIFKT